MASLDSFSLTYRVDIPLDHTIPPPTLTHYAAIFRRLLSLNYAGSALAKTALHLKVGIETPLFLGWKRRVGELRWEGDVCRSWSGVGRGEEGGRRGW